MADDFTITFHGDHIRADIRAHKNYQWAERFWTAIRDACEVHQCYDVLGISESLSVMPFPDGFDHIKLFRELGLDKRYRIAYVELNPEAVETVSFVATALFNRGLPGTYFSTEAEAREWLLGKRARGNDA